MRIEEYSPLLVLTMVVAMRVRAKRARVYAKSVVKSWQFVG
jgi:hypothetical protein